MKLLVIILSFYSIALTALPCGDEVIVNDAQSISITQNTDSNHNNHLDLCSPFCACVCCANIVSESQNPDFKVIQEISTKQIAVTYETSFFNNYFSKIYQPPQV
jgi:hypothetical protein